MRWHPGHSSILEAELFPKQLDLMPETLGFGDSPIERFRASRHAPDDQEEAMTAERDRLENRRLDALVPATRKRELGHSSAPSVFREFKPTKPS